MSDTTTVSPLRQRMIEDMAARNLNPHTQRSQFQSCRPPERVEGVVMPASKNLHKPGSETQPISAVAPSPDMRVVPQEPEPRRSRSSRQA